MTLSRWLRDFLYIPLGGNKKGEFRSYCNLFIVFLLCGLWHGAAWTFVIWGCYHGMWLIIEKVFDNRFHYKMAGFTGNVICFVIVMIGWVLFRSQSLGNALSFLARMFALDRGPQSVQNYTISYYLETNIMFYLSIGFICAFFPHEKLQFKISSNYQIILKGALSLIFITVSAAFLSKATFNPFIYFQF